MKKTVALLISGSGAPARNNFIEHISSRLARLDTRLRIIDGGFKGLVVSHFKDAGVSTFSGASFSSQCVVNGGPCPEFVEFLDYPAAFDKTMDALGTRNLIILGGDGTLMGAKELVNKGCNVVFVPSTRYGDLKFTRYSLGEDSMLNRANSIIISLLDKASRNNHILTALLPNDQLARKFSFAYNLPLLEEGGEEGFVRLCLKKNNEMYGARLVSVAGEAMAPAIEKLNNKIPAIQLEAGLSVRPYVLCRSEFL